MMTLTGRALTLLDAPSPATRARAWRDGDADRQLDAHHDACPQCTARRHHHPVCPACGSLRTTTHLPVLAVVA